MNDLTGAAIQQDGAASTLGFPSHPGRAAAIGEVHARPHPLIETPRILVQLAFMTDAGSSLDHAVLASLSRHLGIAPPVPQARHHTMKWGRGSLRWERHTEFSTYLWEGPILLGSLVETGRDPMADGPFGNAFSAPGTVISGIRLEILPWTDESERLIAGFDPASLCYSLVEKGAAAAITDFRQDRDGLTRILVLDRSLTPARAGALVQRLIEIETYRTLAMLGLPLAQQLSPRISRIEDSLVKLTATMRAGSEGSESLLEELTALAAELEADAAAGLYRFGASRAYHGIVEERLAVLSETAVAGHETWGAFLQRRVAPALRTCRSIEERQANLSRKLSRAADLLRTRVEVDVERQNSDLLASMNRRAKLQLRLQQTVEGLSVAAVSYYVVGLIGYLAKGLSHIGFHAEPEVVVAAAAPLVVVAIWLTVRRIRHRHSDEDRHGGKEDYEA